MPELVSMLCHQVNGRLVQVIDVYDSSTSKSKREKANLHNRLATAMLIDCFVHGDKAVNQYNNRYTTDSSLKINKTNETADSDASVRSKRILENTFCC